MSVLTNVDLESADFMTVENPPEAPQPPTVRETGIFFACAVSTKFLIKVSVEDSIVSSLGDFGILYNAHQYLISRG